MEFNEIIAEKLTSYLKKQMVINAKKLTKNQNDNNQTNISYSKIMNGYLILDQWLLENDKQTENWAIVVQMKYQLQKLIIEKIILSEKEIDEILSYVKTSILKYGIKGTSFNQNPVLFIRMMLMKLMHDMKSSNCEYDCINNALNYFCLNDSIGFGSIDTIISYENNLGLKIIENKEVIYKVKENGAVITDEPFDENALIGNNLYIGWIDYYDESEQLKSKFCLALIKETDDDITYKPIFSDDDICLSIQFYNPINFNDFLKQNNLEKLIKPIYAEQDILKIIKTLNKKRALLLEKTIELEKTKVKKLKK
ncbi:MAG: hypothetical protein PHQ89_00985 [Bacilli bacterium]|nr:hypothetical protein [Bacilli bacterium]